MLTSPLCRVRAAHFILALCATASLAHAQCRLPNWLATDSTVQSNPSTYLTTWDPDAGGPEGEVLVVAGRLTTAPGTQLLGFWNGTWTFPVLDPTITLVEPHAIRGEQNELLVAGRFTLGGTTSERVVAYSRAPGSTNLYNAFVVCDVNGPSVSTRVNALARSNGFLVLAGEFSGVDAVNSPNFFHFGFPQAGGTDGPVYALNVQGPTLYVGGAFGRVGLDTPEAIRTSNVARFASAWQPLGDGVGGGTFSEGVFSISGSYVPNSLRVFIAGAFNNAPPTLNVGHCAEWVGSQWKPVAPGLAPSVRVLRPYAGRLYAGGTFAPPSALATLMAEFDPLATPSQWRPMPIARSPLGTGAIVVSDMTEYRGELIVAGQLAGGGLARFSATSVPWVQTQSSGLNRACSGSIGIGIASGYAFIPNNPILYQWRKNGTPVVGGLRINNVQSPTLSFTSIWASDQGSYDCVVSAPCGSTTSTPVQIVVCISDFNCSGRETIQDIYEFIGAWFSLSPRADMDSNGGLSFQDVLVFMDSWFRTCPPASPDGGSGGD